MVCLTISMLSSCTTDSDAEYPQAKTTLFKETFDNNYTSNHPLTAAGWTSYAQIGAKLWLQKSYKSDGYALFSTYGGTSEPSSVAWLISPEIDMDANAGEKLFFQTCQDGFVRSRDNSIELYVTTNYDATNFNNTNWEKVSFTTPTPESAAYQYIDSGIIDLSSYTGKLRFAFKVKGTSSLTGGYQLDNVSIFY